MGTIKFELDLPDFSKQIEIKVTINKDGVLYASTPLVDRNTDPSLNIVDGTGAGTVWKQYNTPASNTTTNKIPDSMMGNY